MRTLTTTEANKILARLHTIYGHELLVRRQPARGGAEVITVRIRLRPGLIKPIGEFLSLPNHKWLPRFKSETFKGFIRRQLLIPINERRQV